jgi:hypothetical protein
VNTIEAAITELHWEHHIFAIEEDLYRPGRGAPTWCDIDANRFGLTLAGVLELEVKCAADDPLWVAFDEEAGPGVRFRVRPDEPLRLFPWNWRRDRARLCAWAARPNLGFFVKVQVLNDDADRYTI